MHPMMRCGHAANTTNKAGKPSCAICVGVRPGAEEIVETPNFTGRTARCLFYGKPQGRNNEGPCKGDHCTCEETSSPDLAFFYYTPDEPHDTYYCGCHGWD